eukprot:274390-Chlamydomonas_euryale.AAC.1
MQRPIGIITIEDVIEELIRSECGRTWARSWANVCGRSASAKRGAFGASTPFHSIRTTYTQ